MALNPKYADLVRRNLEGSVVEFKNSSGVNIFIKFTGGDIKATEEQLAAFEVYHKLNLQLRELKNKLAVALTSGSYDFEPYANDTVSQAILKELKAVAVKDSWENECVPSILMQNKCKQTLQFWKTEAGSMPFNALVLAESVVFVKSKKTTILINVDEKGKATYGNIDDKQVTTILGLGPSGCGKSFLAEQVFECVSFVETVVALDGGITRTSSNVYQMATAFHPPRHNIGDLYDLFKDTADNKKTMAETLKTLRSSLYVPTTFVSDVVGLNWTNLKKLTERGLAGEQPYIGMFIMQHCKSCDIPCPFQYVNPSFQCVGCDESGNSRALVEGKKWENKTFALPHVSGTTFTVALNYGYKALFTTEYGMQTKYPIFIHNAGKPGNVSVLAHALPDATINLSSLKPSVFRVLPMDFQKDFATFEKMLVQAVKTSVKTEFRQAVASNITETKALSSKVGELHDTVLEKLGTEVGKLTSAMSALTVRMGSLETDVVSNKAEFASIKAVLSELQRKPLAETGPTVQATKKWWRFGFGGKKRMRTKRRRRNRSSQLK